MSAAQLYQETAVTTQSKGKLIVMLYDGAIKFLKIAIQKIDENDVEGQNTYIKKAMAIINELNVVLDMDAGGDISINLRKLYNFMQEHLIKAHAKKDVAMIQEVINLLDELNQGWKSITD